MKPRIPATPPPGSAGNAYRADRRQRMNHDGNRADKRADQKLN
jgi:hypothetical protein